MNKTINRTPLQMPIPNSRDQYFNHADWKGINTTKNAIGIDQQTFIEADNVFVNSQQILTSRPPVIQRDKWGLTNIVNMWSFGQHMVVQTYNSAVNKYYINFVHNNVLIPVVDNEINEDVTVILLTRKIFVLDSGKEGPPIVQGRFSAFDIVDNDWEPDAKQYIYIPKNEEGENLLRPGAKEEYYVWLTDESIDWRRFIDKDVIVVIDGETFYLAYELGMQKTWISKFGPTYTSTEIFASRIKLQTSGTPRFAFYEDGVLYHSSSGTVFNAAPVDEYTDFELQMVSERGDSIWGFAYKDGRKFVRVYDILNSSWGMPAYNGAPATGVNPFVIGTVIDTDSNPGTFTSLYAYDKDTWAVYSYWISGTVRGEYTYFNAIDFNEYLRISTSSVLYPLLGSTIFIGILNNYVYVLCLICENHGSQSRFKHIIRRTDLKGANGVGNTDYVSQSHHPSTVKFSRDVILKSASRYDTSLTPPVQKTYIVFRYTVRWGHYSELSELQEYYWNSNEVVPVLFSALPLYANTNLLLDEFSSVVTSDNLIELSPPFVDLSDTTTKVTWLLNNDTVPIYNDATTIWSYNSDTQELYKTNAKNDITVSMLDEGTVTPMFFKHWLEWGDLMLSNGRNLYIARYKTDKDGVFSWYIRERGGDGSSPDIKEFNFDITGLHILSNNEMAVFMEHEIWITSLQQAADNLYYFVKSKLPIGIKQGSDVLTTFDGKYIMFSCERGLVALQYQEFMATTEQALTFISDALNFDEFNKGPIKLYQYKHWVAIYRLDLKQFYMLDMRNGSWWTWTLPQPTQNIVTYNEVPLSLQNNDLFVIGDYDNYSDDGKIINWTITSQLLHFGAINNFKQILNFILNSVDTKDRFTFSLQIINYRRVNDIRKREVFEYDVDTIRTFIKRMQFSKVNEFQYQIKNSNTKVPLRLTDISIKYIITERLR